MLRNGSGPSSQDGIGAKEAGRTGSGMRGRRGCAGLGLTVGKRRLCMKSSLEARPSGGGRRVRFGPTFGLVYVTPVSLPVCCTEGFIACVEQAWPSFGYSKVWLCFVGKARFVLFAPSGLHDDFVISIESFASQSSAERTLSQAKEGLPISPQCVGFERSSFKSHFHSRTQTSSQGTRSSSQGTKAKVVRDQNVKCPHRTCLDLPQSKPLTAANVKEAFRKQALKWHPDRHTEGSRADAEERFKEVVMAYEALKATA